ncbi:Tuftelin-interacting protein 11 [Apophysomyces sp. BC1034]|nr:Tuftelin-interacting protein 11 [Apophysomyces sp. BC1015]KAG0181945.1 Tuftelin-interacting protein 11 [Apophysomyces sp. BC1021]KAG0192939.1 Tuftelin-interacting protein 11 [Apophysomyces sp. BC1034]
MGRRKKYIDDGGDSSDEEAGRINFEITENDLEDELGGFSGVRKRKRFADEDSDDEESNSRGGLGSGSMANSMGPNFTLGTDSPKATPRATEKIPKSREASSTPPPAALAADFAKFNKFTKGFGKKMLEKMGWSLGKGLGAGGEGIINPVETKQRPARMGMGFKGFDERTDQAKAQAKVAEEESESESDREEAVRAKRGAWKRDTHRPRKPKTVYRTAEQIVADTMGQEIPLSQQKVIDMRGPAVREVSLSEIERTESPTLMETTTRLPELRHNIRLLVDLSRADLENLSREKQTNAFRMKAMTDELNVIEERRTIGTVEKQKIEEANAVAQQLQRISKDALATGAYEQANISSLFGDAFEKLETDYLEQVESLGLDALVVAVWAPIMKYKSVHWDVLAEPTWGANDVKRWRRLLLCNDDKENQQNGLYRAHISRKPKELTATPYEMMMNTIWLAKVRSAINNSWDVRDPDTLIQLLEAWQPPVLPRFIFENIINQLLLPKISRAVSDWDPRNDPEMIHTWLHPWLPILQAWRLADIFTNVRHKLAVVLRQWHPSDESAYHIITPWRDVWTPSQLESFLIKTILPRLSQVLLHEFVVNPRDQQLEPLIWCLAWKDMFSETIMGQLLENEFFKKWLDVLYKWLTLDRSRVNYDEVREWYLWWKQVFASYGLDSNKHVAQSFRKGLDMMSMAASGETVVKP